MCRAVGAIHRWTNASDLDAERIAARIADELEPSPPLAIDGVSAAAIRSDWFGHAIDLRTAVLGPRELVDGRRVLGPAMGAHNATPILARACQAAYEVVRARLSYVALLNHTANAPPHVRPIPSMRTSRSVTPGFTWAWT